MYDGDITKIRLNEEEEIMDPISRGIRQGCTGSTTLFKPITFKIMQELEKLDQGYKDEHFNITSLYFADNGMVLLSSVEDAEKVIEQVIKTGRENGLQINKQKSNIIVSKMKQKLGEISEIKVIIELKYLGMNINDNRNLFKVQK